MSYETQFTSLFSESRACLRKELLNFKGLLYSSSREFLVQNKKALVIKRENEILNEYNLDNLVHSDKNDIMNENPFDRAH